MIVLTNSAPVTLAVGAAMTFDTVLLKNCCTECHNRNSASIKMTTPNTYLVSFSGDISGATAGTPVQLSISQGVDIVPGSVMTSTPATADTFNNVSKTMYIGNCCCDYDRITIVNTGTTPVTIGPNSSFSVGVACCCY